MTQGISWRPGVFDGAGADGLPIPARLVAHATVALAPAGGLHVREAGHDIAPSGGPYTAVLCDGGAFHYFHLMESLVWLWAIQHRFIAGRPPSCIVLSIAWDDPRQHGIGRQIAAALYPGVTLRDPNGHWPEVFTETLVLDRSWARMRINKYLEAASGWAAPALRHAAGAIRASLRAHMGHHESQRILYVSRPPPRQLAPPVERRLLERLRALGTCTEMDFAAVPWAHQVRLAAAHDVMVGVHGNGLTNVLWMRPGGTLIELFPPGVRHYDYQLFAELGGQAYYGIDGTVVYRDGDRFGAPRGHQGPTQAPVLEVNCDLVVEAVSLSKQGLLF